MALASSYDLVSFDNFSVQPCAGRVPGIAPEWRNLALGKKAAASAQTDADHSPAQALDGNHATDWCPGQTTNQWLEVDFGQDESFDRVVFDQHKPSPWVPGGDISAYRLEYWNGTNWVTAHTGVNIAPPRHLDDFLPVRSQKVRLRLDACGENATVWEFQVFRRRP